jgi:hypothetical protein
MLKGIQYGTIFLMFIPGVVGLSVKNIIEGINVVVIMICQGKKWIWSWFLMPVNMNKV